MMGDLLILMSWRGYVTFLVGLSGYTREEAIKTAREEYKRQHGVYPEDDVDALLKTGFWGSGDEA